jgi:hypothetical protein
MSFTVGDLFIAFMVGAHLRYLKPWLRRTGRRIIKNRSDRNG